MTTEVIMKRELMGGEISQKSKTELFSATDLLKIGNKHRMLNGMQPFHFQVWLRNNSTQDFIKELKKQYKDVYIPGRGRGKHTWVHPFLFIDLALSLSPTLKIEVYKWLYDFLLKYRNDSGDSYKRMAGALYFNQSNKSEYPKYICDVAKKIKEACGVDDWQKATEKQLEKRDNIHNNISLLCDVLKSNDKAVEYAIKKTA